MPTSQFVESGFWNFDTLFVPQQHPARDLQDTFYISDPAVSKQPPKDYYDKVSTVHSVSYSSLLFITLDNLVRLVDLVQQDTERLGTKQILPNCS
jgi:phenylalanyl-tRNA synthetase alpha subunit